MDKEYIIKHNLMEAHNQFMRLSEGYFASNISEAGEEDPQQNTPDMAGNMPQEPGNGQPMPGGEQTQDTMPPEQPMGDMTQGGGQTPPMDNGMPDTGAELDMNVDDDVLDVEDLTQAQEKLNKKQNEIGHDLGDVDDRIIAVLTAIDKIKDSIDKNNSDINNLKAELEKRMPTKTEKLNMQSLKMYPYNTNPVEYWKDKEKDGVYQAEYDSQEPEVKKQYEITNDDVEDYSDRDIENSFDDKLHQTMKDIFKGF